MTTRFSGTHPRMEVLHIKLLRQASPTRKMQMLALKVTEVFEKMSVPYLLGASLRATPFFRPIP